MKKNKGFTLIELMATILILGVISLIAVLIINNIIRTVKQEAFRDSTYGYVKAASNYYVVEDGKGNFSAKTIKYTNKKADLNILNLQSQSYVPDEGKLEIAEDEKIAVAFYDQSLDMCAYKNTEEDKVNLVSVNNPSECTFNGKKKLPEGKDITGLCNDSLSYADTTNYQILNVEGLVCFSQQVDSGKDFNGKVVKQVSNIDIKNKDSYENDKTKKYGDINENGIEEDLYTELNTEKGFNPIGKNTNNYKFAGTYEGYGYELRNLYINRPSEDYIGLFAYNEGLIRGMNIYDIDINGYNVVGGIAGHNNNTGVINEIKITGDIIGYTQVGGAVGVSASAITTSILANTNITSTYPSSGSVSMGGIVGSHYYGIISGIFNGGSINTHAGTYYTGYITGYNVGGTADGLYLDSITVDGPIASGYNGAIYSYDTINTYDEILDTWIGGDNDSSGYYFDYNELNEIVVKSTQKNHLHLI